MPTGPTLPASASIPDGPWQWQNTTGRGWLYCSTAAHPTDPDCTHARDGRFDQPWPGDWTGVIAGALLGIGALAVGVNQALPDVARDPIAVWPVYVENTWYAAPYADDQFDHEVLMRRIRDVEREGSITALGWESFDCDGRFVSIGVRLYEHDYRPGKRNDDESYVYQLPRDAFHIYAAGVIRGDRPPLDQIRPVLK